MTFKEWYHTPNYGTFSSREEWVLDAYKYKDYGTIKKFIEAAYKAGEAEGIRQEKEKDYEC